MKNIKVSIIIPIYNVENYLRICLESIYNIINVDKEIILVNDGSTDNSFSIIEEFYNKYKDITTIINQENKGLSGARNSGIKVAKGEYISFIDSDDYVLKKEYENFISEGIKSKCDFILGNGIKFWGNGQREILTKDKYIYKKETLSGKELFKILIDKKSYRDEVCYNLYRKDFLIENNLFFHENLYHEDTLFTPYVFIKAEKAICLPFDFYMYRQREDSIMAKKRNDKKIKDQLFILEELIKLCKKEKIYFCSNSLIRMYYTLVKEEKINNREILKELFKLKNKSWHSRKRLLKCFLLSKHEVD